VESFDRRLGANERNELELRGVQRTQGFILMGRIHQDRHRKRGFMAPTTAFPAILWRRLI
jgi:hypothetical protein